MNWYLETERIHLRAIDGGDAANLFDLNSDPEVMRYLSPEFCSYEECVENLKKIVERNERYKNQLGLFAAIEKESEKFIGWFILRPDKNTPEDFKNLEIGYRLKKTVWGKGYASEVSFKLIEKAKEDFGVHRVYAMAIKGNHASIKVMEKIGLGFEKQYIQENFPGPNKEAVLYSRQF